MKLNLFWRIALFMIIGIVIVFISRIHIAFALLSTLYLPVGCLYVEYLRKIGWRTKLLDLSAVVSWLATIVIFSTMFRGGEPIRVLIGIFALFIITLIAVFIAWFLFCFVGILLRNKKLLQTERCCEKDC